MPGTKWKFIGLENYRNLFTDPTVRVAIWNSFKMMILTVVFEVGIAFVLAVLVSNIKKFSAGIPYCIFFPGSYICNSNRFVV